MAESQQSKSPRISGRYRGYVGDYCCVPGCTNLRGKCSREKKKVSFYQMPRESKLKQLWLDRIRRGVINKEGKVDEFVPKSHSRICSAHFVGGAKANDASHPAYVPTLFPRNVAKQRQTKTAVLAGQFHQVLSKQFLLLASTNDIMNKLIEESSQDKTVDCLGEFHTNEEKMAEIETCEGTTSGTGEYGRSADTGVEQALPRQEEKHLIQILASNEEINRRIAALVEQKQRENDENNCQEFCGVHPGFQDLEDQCARTAAVFVPRAGGKSHIKVSRVVNMYGPQTRALGISDMDRSLNQLEKRPVNSMMTGIEERLANMEQHLKVTGSSKVDVYSRLKSLEERILFLESLSPEYFTSGPPLPKRSRHEGKSTRTSARDIDQELSLSEIDSRMQALRDSLLSKTVER